MLISELGSIWSKYMFTVAFTRGLYSGKKDFSNLAISDYNPRGLYTENSGTWFLVNFWHFDKFFSISLWLWWLPLPLCFMWFECPRYCTFIIKLINIESKLKRRVEFCYTYTLHSIVLHIRIHIVHSSYHALFSNLLAFALRCSQYKRVYFIHVPRVFYKTPKKNPQNFSGFSFLASWFIPWLSIA